MGQKGTALRCNQCISLTLNARQADIVTYHSSRAPRRISEFKAETKQHYLQSPEVFFNVEKQNLNLNKYVNRTIRVDRSSPEQPFIQFLDGQGNASTSFVPRQFKEIVAVVKLDNCRYKRRFDGANGNFRAGAYIVFSPDAKADVEVDEPVTAGPPTITKARSGSVVDPPPSRLTPTKPDIGRGGAGASGLRDSPARSFDDSFVMSTAARRDAVDDSVLGAPARRDAVVAGSSTLTSLPSEGKQRTPQKGGTINPAATMSYVARDSAILSAPLQPQRPYLVDFANVDELDLFMAIIGVTFNRMYVPRLVPKPSTEEGPRDKQIPCEFVRARAGPGMLAKELCITGLWLGPDDRPDQWDPSSALSPSTPSPLELNALFVYSLGGSQDPPLSLAGATPTKAPGHVPHYSMASMSIANNITSLAEPDVNSGSSSSSGSSASDASHDDDEKSEGKSARPSNKLPAVRLDDATLPPYENNAAPFVSGLPYKILLHQITRWECSMADPTVVRVWHTQAQAPVTLGFETEADRRSFATPILALLERMAEQSLLEMGFAKDQHESALARLKARQLNAYVSTWNAGNDLASAANFEAETPFSHPPLGLHDLYVIGCQECNTFDAWVQQNMNAGINAAQQYSLIAKRVIGQMGICIFIRSHLTRFVSNVMVHAIPLAGPGAVLSEALATKGSAIAEFTFMGERLSFASSHLAPHDTDKDLEARNNMVKIIDEFRKNRGAQVTFLFGDLNYRSAVSLSRDDAKALLERDYDAYRRTDQLTTLLTTRPVTAAHVACYSEMPIQFPPTYRWSKSSASEYNLEKEKHKPSWCDRILWRCETSNLHVGCDGLEYHSLPNKLGSDHRLVYGVFTLSF